jgi:hypothetical protein
MDNVVWTGIGNKLESDYPKFGTVTVELVYHEGKVTHYFINRSDRFNIPQNGNNNGN